MSRDLDGALEAARAGVEVVRSYSNKSLNTRLKGPKNDLVTDADFASEKEIMRVIRSGFPDDLILAEETASDLKQVNGRMWMVDPIDGTTNFANGFPIYCVSVGLWEGGRPLAGVVIEVNRNEEFAAACGQGATLDGDPLKIEDLDDPAEALIGTGFPYKDLSLADDYIRLFRNLMDEVQGIRRPGSAAYDLCCVAANRFQGFYEYGLSAWDVAAASLIIQEAGGVVTDWKGGEDWLFGKRIVAGSRSVHELLLKNIGRDIASHNLSI